MTTVLQDDEMLCPYCAEVIKKEAIVCKHCHRGLTDTVTNETVTPTRIETMTKKAKILQQAVVEYQKDGWILVGAVGESAQLTKARPHPSMMWWAVWGGSLIASLFTCGVLLVVPLAMGIQWWMQKPGLIVLTVDENNKVVVTGNKPPADAWGRSQKSKSAQEPVPAAPAVVRPQTPEEKEKAAASTRKALIIIGALILGMIFLCAIVSSLSSSHNVPAVLAPLAGFV